MVNKSVILTLGFCLLATPVKAYEAPPATCANDGQHANVFNKATNSWSCVTITASSWGNHASAGYLTGAGTVGYTPKYTSSGILGNSLLFSGATGVGINNTSPAYALDVTGVAKATGVLATTATIGTTYGNLVGNVTGNASSVTSVTASQLPLFTATTNGAVIASAGGTANFLRADGTWAAPAGGGSGTVSTGTAGQTAYYATGGTAVSGTSALTLGTNTVSINSALLLSGTNTHAQLASTNAGITVANVLPTNMWVNPVSDTKFGYNALMMSATTGENTAIGGYAMQNIAPEGYYTPDYSTYGNGWGNVAVGFGAMRAATASGCPAGNASSSWNTAVGTYTLEHLTCGWNNEAYGRIALNAVTDGYNNVAMGSHAYRYTTTGYENTGMGSAVGDANISGHNNALFGYYAGNGVQGSNNTILGSNVAQTGLTTGSYNILVGSGSAVTTPTTSTSNYLNIGNLIQGDLTNKRVSIGASNNTLPTTNTLSITGTTSTTNAIVTSISGSTQCVQADSTGKLSGTGAACGSGGGSSIVFQIVPEETPDILDTAGRVFPHVYVGAGGNASPREKVTGVMASLSANATINMRFPVPMSVPSGTMKLKLVGMASATSGAAKITIADAIVADSASPTAATLTSETQQTVTWATGDTDKYKVTKVALTSTPTAGSTLVVAVTFNNTGWTLAALSGWKFYLIWE